MRNITSLNRAGGDSIKLHSLKRAVEILRDGGIKDLSLKLLDETRIYRRVLLLERSLDKITPNIKPPIPVKIDLLKETEIDEYLALYTGSNPSPVPGRFGAGHLCFAARYDGQIISASWAATEKAWSHYLSREIPLGQDEVYVYDSFTKHDFRGLSISPAVRAEMIRYFRSAGYRRMIIAVIPENRSNIRAIQKVGFSPFGIMGYIKVGPWRWDFQKINKIVGGLHA